jgi:hypothetical protein
MGPEAHSSHKYLDSQLESQSQLSCGETQDRSQDLDSDPESQSLFVTYKSELAAIKGKDNNFVEVISVISFF